MKFFYEIFYFSLKFGAQCLTDQWPPKADRVVPTHIVNLDLPPVQRWNEVAAAYKPQVR